MSKRTWILPVIALVVAAVPIGSAAAQPSGGHRPALTMAVFGDAPYGTSPTDTAQLDVMPAFIDSINGDPDVTGVVHVGDIHSGKQFCTEAYDRSIAALWGRFTDPLVYTPGDNEWADCHKAAEGGGTYNSDTGQIDYVKDASGTPVDYAQGEPAANLALVRSIFFPRAGATLGSGQQRVLSQATLHDRRHPTDAQYVENVLWARAGVVFITVNVPGGSNNDTDPWYKAPTQTQAQTDDVANRTAADIRWLDTAFELARLGRAAGVVVIEQADMWDLDMKTADHLTGYESIVADIASNTTAFGRPVLMFNGDSHTFRSDNPLAPAAPCIGDSDVCSYDAWNSHPTYNVGNFHRVVVHGSTSPLEWLKLTIDPGVVGGNGDSSFGPFSWQRMTQP